MRERRHERIEAAIDHLAAILFAGALAYALIGLAGSPLSDLQLRATAALSTPLVYLLMLAALRQVSGAPSGFAVRAFTPAELDFALTDELLLTDQVEVVLTDADRLEAGDASEDELVLDDILATLSPDSRVVRLFDTASLPTPGELNARIARHARSAAPAAQAYADGAPDASQALYDALAQLRRSLR